MSEIFKYYIRMPDGTIKHTNPFTGTEVWSVPRRANKPITNKIPKDAKKIEKQEKENYCNFCESSYFNTPPEESRMVNIGGNWEIKENLTYNDVFSCAAEFRRIPNLFEILSFDYWEKNFQYKLTKKLQDWKDSYISDVKGYEHIENIIKLKMKLLGKSDEEIKNTPKDEIIKASDAFFGGTHELIVAKRHFKEDAEYDTQLCSSGCLTEEEHFNYMKFTIFAMRDIFENNSYVRYISVFQNWLSPAGASFDHLHKQLVALDEWGSSVEREISGIRQNPNIYNECAANLAGYLNLLIAENEHAIAFSGIGHRYPTIAIYSKSKNTRPEDHTEEELRGFSNLVRACHSSMSNQIPCNEEWYYSPIDTDAKMPWHILIKWRILNPAGFEGGTRIFINPTSPELVKDRMVNRLNELMDKNLISKNIKFGAECKIRPNILNYNK